MPCKENANIFTLVTIILNLLPFFGVEAVLSQKNGKIIRALMVSMSKSNTAAYICNKIKKEFLIMRMYSKVEIYQYIPFSISEKKKVLYLAEINFPSPLG
jgi:hypothetical protein